MAQVESVYPVRPATVEGNEVATMETAAADVEAVRKLPSSLFDPKPKLPSSLIDPKPKRRRFQGNRPPEDYGDLLSIGWGVH